MTVYHQHQDTRDGKIYNCVLMPDGKWWAAENLAWDGAGVYYNNDPALGAIYGRLYSWDEALVACPPGSHLPPQTEYETMLAMVGAGRKLMSTVLWPAPLVGTDDYGFSALPSGYRYGNESSDINYRAYFRTSTPIDANLAKAFDIYESGAAVFENQLKSVSFSVRFIVDVFNEPTPSPYDFQPPPGTYTSPQSVSLNKSGFVYTTDGSDPTDDSKPFISPIRVSGPTEIKVKRLQSPEIFTFAYIVKGKPMEQYKQQASMQAGAASIEFITRTQTL